MPSGRAALGRLKGYIQAEEAATSSAILVPGDSPPLFDTSGDEPPDVIKVVLSSEVLSYRFMDETRGGALQRRTRPNC